MTIKRRLFFSNIRMVLITIGGLMFALFGNAVVMRGIMIHHGFNGFMDIEAYRRLAGIAMLASLAVFVVFFIIVNRIFSKRMTEKITRPLEILTAGVSRIRQNDFSFRIEYEQESDDEFYQVCEAFNLMAGQLEASTAQRLKDEANRRELLAGISHDLRTPLTTIGGYLDGIESGVASTPEMRKKYFDTIKKTTANMKHIIEQLFLFSKLDMDEFPFAPSRFDLTRAVFDITEELTQEYDRRGLEIIFGECPEHIFVRADLSHFRSVVVNILENSTKYKKKERGKLEISAIADSRGGNFAEITFADNGTGVPSAALPNLFNAFYRSDPSRHAKGSGLGLAISAKIIERSGGSIHAQNVSSGGLAIVIRLPINREGA
ncbi:MAG: HAMP domain-containing histidine kinase [Spirochaetes bacterium]|nr:HAMP domain-containing histidine kinase [Spirochaetota bacterium]